MGAILPGMSRGYICAYLSTFEMIGVNGVDGQVVGCIADAY